MAKADPPAPRQLEIAGAGVPDRIPALDSACRAKLDAKAEVARQKKLEKEAKARIQLQLVKHDLSSYRFLDGAEKRRFYRQSTEEIKDEKIKELADKSTRKQRLGGDKHKARKAQPVMPAPQASP